MIIMKSLSNDIDTSIFTGRYLILLEKHGYDVTGVAVRAMRIKKANISPSGKTIVFQGLEGYNSLGIWFDSGENGNNFIARNDTPKIDIFSDDPDVLQRLVSYTVRLGGQKFLLCDTLEEFLFVRNREIERDTAKKLAIAEVERKLGFAYMEDGEELVIS